MPWPFITEDLSSASETFLGGKIKPIVQSQPIGLPTLSFHFGAKGGVPGGADLE